MSYTFLGANAPLGPASSVCLSVCLSNTLAPICYKRLRLGGGEKGGIRDGKLHIYIYIYKSSSYL